MKTIKIFIIAMIGVIGFFGTYAVCGGMTPKKGADVNNKTGKTEIATFAGGCFWCTESDFEKAPGVTKVISGYTGGESKNPTYEDVSSGRSGHIEAVQVYFDPGVISYEKLLEYFFRHVDPTDPGGQFVDRGSQYVSAIFYHNQGQKEAAEAAIKAQGLSGRFKKPIVTKIQKLKTFYEAEKYHQDYYKNNPFRYNNYRSHSGRDSFLKKVWANEPFNHKEEKNKFQRPPESELKKTLTPMQYKVAREDGTEPPFKNEYWDNKKEGIYVDIVSGEPLFSSLDKFASGTGWPSFTKPLVPENIVEKQDMRLFMVRTEVRSRNGDSHLGHLFDDGPAPTGLRYCINSASLLFIPKGELDKKGYGQYVKLFNKE